VWVLGPGVQKSLRSGRGRAGAPQGAARTGGDDDGAAAGRLAVAERRVVQRVLQPGGRQMRRALRRSPRQGRHGPHTASPCAVRPSQTARPHSTHPLCSTGDICMTASAASAQLQGMRHDDSTEAGLLSTETCTRNKSQPRHKLSQHSAKRPPRARFGLAGLLRTRRSSGRAGARLDPALAVGRFGSLVVQVQRERH